MVDGSGHTDTEWTHSQPRRGLENRVEGAGGGWNSDVDIGRDQCKEGGVRDGWRAVEEGGRSGENWQWRRKERVVGNIIISQLLLNRRRDSWEYAQRS